MEKLVDLAKRADDLENAWYNGRVAPETAGDTIRVLRSQIRTWTKGGMDQQPGLLDWLDDRLGRNNNNK